MAGPKTDSYANEPIHFSEAYRRAKRNVLFWALTTIVVALGAHGDKAIEVTGLVDGLAFQVWPLLIGLLIILAFMFASYIRAEQDLIYLNSEQVVSQRMKEAIDVVESVKAKLLELRSEVSQQEYRLRNVYEGADEARTQLNLQLDSAFEEYISSSEARVRHELQSGSLTPKEAHDRAIRCVRELTKDAKKLLAEWSRIHIDFGKNRPKLPNSEQADRAFAQVTAPFDELTNRLTGLSNSISIRQKRWFFWQDRVPVWAACAVALLGAVVRLQASETLDSWFDMESADLSMIAPNKNAIEVAPGLEQEILNDSSEAPRS